MKAWSSASPAGSPTSATPVKRGQALLEIETDKAVQEVECIANGTLQTIHVQTGQKVAVGTIIATIKVS